MMKRYELIASCHFGLEAVLKREIYDLGYEVIRVGDGRVTFEGDAEAICRANIGLRTAQRILIRIGSFFAASFDALFEGTKALPWEEYLPENARFWVKKASVVKSVIKSVPDIQSVIKKAIVTRLSAVYGREQFPEDGAEYPLRVFFHKDQVTIGLDSSGESLHKRGYRLLHGKAPIEETLAAGMILLTPWREGRRLADFFCGSGTIPIEAAMIEARIAPGLNRRFAACDWNNLIDPKLWEDCYAEAREEAKDGIRDSLARQKKWQGRPYIFGSDQDEAIIRAARQNAKRAGVDRMIAFHCCPVAEVKGEEWYGDFGFLISNPPYGERMGEEDEVRQLYRDIRTALMRLPTWSAWLISSYGNLERELGKKAGKKRKLYNGMLRTDYYAFPGPKPPGHR